ncbi:MAG: enoyl-CoA hydratase/isomerase family protein [Candidatus Sericytochromatia bacterium]
MNTDLVLCHSEAGTTRLTLNRPEQLNALSIPLLEALIGQLERLRHDPQTRVLVLTGIGTRAFCAGADIDSFYSESQGAISEHAFRERLVQLFELLLHLPFPSIARVNGFALGGGFGLAMACDLVVAADSARFGTPEVNIGLFPMVIMPVLARSIGRKHLLELMFTGRKLSAKQALEWGLINDVVESEHLDARVQELSAQISSKSRHTLALGREAFYTMADLPQSTAMAYLKEMLSQNLHSQDAREGLQAFLEKRPPVWQDR